MQLPQLTPLCHLRQAAPGRDWFAPWSKTAVFWTCRTRLNGIPFYAALPSSTIDWTIRDGIREIPIEERSAEEVSHISGYDNEAGKLARVRIIPESSSAANPAEIGIKMALACIP